MTQTQTRKHTHKEQEEKTAYRTDDIYLIINDKKSSKKSKFYSSINNIISSANI